MRRIDYIDMYRERTIKLFNNINEYNYDDVMSIVEEYIENVFCDLDIAIVDIAMYGSRSKGTESNSSDLDIVVEYKGDYKEDYVFNILHEEPLYIGDIIVDINPINEDYSYSITEYLRKAEAYHRANTKKTSR